MRKALSPTKKTDFSSPADGDKEETVDEDDKILNEMEELTYAMERKKKRQRKLLAKRRAKVWLSCNGLREKTTSPTIWIKEPNWHLILSGQGTEGLRDASGCFGRWLHGSWIVFSFFHQGKLLVLHALFSNCFMISLACSTVLLVELVSLACTGAMYVNILLLPPLFGWRSRGGRDNMDRYPSVFCNYGYLEMVGYISSCSFLLLSSPWDSKVSMILASCPFPLPEFIREMIFITSSSVHMFAYVWWVSVIKAQIIELRLWKMALVFPKRRFVKY